MYSGSGLSISPIEEMANCYIEIDYRLLLHHTTMTETLLRNPMAIQPIGIIVGID